MPHSQNKQNGIWFLRANYIIKPPTQTREKFFYLSSGQQKISKETIRKSYQPWLVNRDSHKYDNHKMNQPL